MRNCNILISIKFNHNLVRCLINFSGNFYHNIHRVLVILFSNNLSEWKKISRKNGGGVYEAMQAWEYCRIAGTV